MCEAAWGLQGDSRTCLQTQLPLLPITTQNGLRPLDRWDRPVTDMLHPITVTTQIDLKPTEKPHKQLQTLQTKQLETSNYKAAEAMILARLVGEWALSSNKRKFLSIQI